MPDKFAYDAVVVGSGPNGLAAAIRLAQEKLSVLVLEAKEGIGGGTRSAEITLRGFTHDLCSAVHPLGIGSPFFRQLPLEKYGLSWIQPEIPLAHPLDNGTASLLQQSVTATGQGFAKRSRRPRSTSRTSAQRSIPTIGSLNAPWAYQAAER